MLRAPRALKSIYIILIYKALKTLLGGPNWALISYIRAVMSPNKSWHGWKGRVAGC